MFVNFDALTRKMLKNARVFAREKVRRKTRASALRPLDPSEEGLCPSSEGSSGRAHFFHN